MSSLLSEDQQIPLPGGTAGAPDELFRETEGKGQYTGERLFHHRRRDYDLIVRMLGEGLSCISIARIMACAEKTVAGVRDREMAHLKTPDVKLAMGQRWTQTAHLALDIMQEIAEDPDRRKKVSFRDAAIAGSIATQNQQLLAGEATARLEMVAPESGHNDLNEFLERMRAGIPAPETKSPEPLPAPGVVVDA